MDARSAAGGAKFRSQTTSDPDSVPAVSVDSTEVALPLPLQPAVGEKLGRYAIRRELGHGGGGSVYLAEDEELRRLVAIKVPRVSPFASAGAVERFLDEARTVARLRHPGIVAVYNVERGGDGTPYVVMEFIEGPSLEQLLAAGRPAYARAAELVAAIAEAVDHAHRQGFVHRDLKPANVLLDQAGDPHVADFGLALHESVQREREGEFAGTMRYMAPEQIRGEVHRLDGRTDLWALGVMLYEMLAGRRPFDGSDEILNREPKPPRQIDAEIPAELERICLKCLRKPIAERYTTARDLAADLRRWQRPQRRRAWLLAATAAACAVLLAAVAGILWRFARPAVQSPAAAPLRAAMDVLVWDPQDPARRGIGLREPGALPLRTRDQIRIAATLNRPAYVYLLWIDSEGQVLPVYPWRPGRWSERPAEESPCDRLSLPPRHDAGWPMGGVRGMETLVLLARDEPLPPAVDLQAALGGLGRQPCQGASDAALVEFENGIAVSVAKEQDRGPQFFDAEQIDDPVLKTQRRLAEALGPHFPLIRAVSFANRGK
jgi:hypothetical protein